MQMLLPIRRNHMGRRWIPPSLSVVARFAMRVIERSLSISVELRTGGLFSAMSGEWPVTFLLLQEAAFDMISWSATDGVASTISTVVAIFLLLLSPFLHSIIEFDTVY